MQKWHQPYSWRAPSIGIENTKRRCVDGILELYPKWVFGLGTEIDVLNELKQLAPGEEDKSLKSSEN